VGRERKKGRGSPSNRYLEIEKERKTILLSGEKGGNNSCYWKEQNQRGKKRGGGERKRGGGGAICVHVKKGEKGSYQKRCVFVFNKFNSEI